MTFGSSAEMQKLAFKLILYTQTVCVCVCVHNLIKKGLCKVSKTSTMCYLHHFSFIWQHVIHRLKVVLLEMFDQRRN